MNFLRLLAQAVQVNVNEAGNDGGINIPHSSANDVLANILNIVYIAAGITAIIVIVIAGYTFVTGGSNPQQVAKAKSTILYAVIGLVVIGLAFVITQFVLGRF